MNAVGLQCVSCGCKFELGPFFEGCSSCKRPGEIAAALEVIYDLNFVRRQIPNSQSRPKPVGLWGYSWLLPARKPSEVVTLGEGGTPLIRLPRNQVNPLSNLYVKNEVFNPTNAFKDRFHTVSLSVARELGFTKTVASTTGNHGLSMAAYAAAAGMAAAVFVDDRSPIVQRRAMELTGASVVIKRDRKTALAAFVKQGWYPSTHMTPMPVATPYGVEGYKTIAFEVLDELGRPPEHFFFPTAAGDGFYGPWKGFREYYELGLAAALPKMHAVQSATADWLVKTLESGQSTPVVQSDADSIALSIADPTGGAICLQTIRDSAGSAIEVTEREIIMATRELAHMGHIVEPASAASVAGAWKLHREGSLDEDSLCVAVLTGSGLKWPEALHEVLGPTTELEDPTGADLTRLSRMQA